MYVAKVITKKGEQFFEVLNIGTVQFDRRDGWVLLASPIGARRPKQELTWVHPEDVKFEWVLKFNF